MDLMYVGARVGVKTQETYAKGQTIPPRFFGTIVEANGDGLSGYVDLDLTAAQKDDLRQVFTGPPALVEQRIKAASSRKFFHASELDEA